MNDCLICFINSSYLLLQSVGSHRRSAGSRPRLLSTKVSGEVWASGTLEVIVSTFLKWWIGLVLVTWQSDMLTQRGGHVRYLNILGIKQMILKC